MAQGLDNAADFMKYLQAQRSSMEPRGAAVG